MDKDKSKRLQDRLIELETINRGIANLARQLDKYYECREVLQDRIIDGNY